MKVLYISNGLTHYYNRVLSRLNSQPDINLTVVFPKNTGKNIGDGVFQTKEGINFDLVELEERRLFHVYHTFRGLSELLLRLRPDVIVVLDSYLHAFLFDFSVVLARRKIGASLILKTIPFRLPSYNDAYASAEPTAASLSKLPSLLRHVVEWSGIIRMIRRGLLATNRHAFRMVDAHVNYVEAFDIWDSYGVARNKIFITRNSPDTDLMLDVKRSLNDAPAVLPDNLYRILHVGRLIPWKRVDMLIRVFNRVRERYPKAELVIIGTGPEEEALKNLTHSLCLDSSVLFIGGVYEPTLLGSYFKACSLYVLAGMGGLSINDAMCFDLPILCSVGDGTERVLVRDGLNGKYFRDGDENDLYEKIIWLFERAEMLPEMGKESGRIIREEVNINTVINGYLEAFRFAAHH